MGVTGGRSRQDPTRDIIAGGTYTYLHYRSRDRGDFSFTRQIRPHTPFSQSSPHLVMSNKGFNGRCHELFSRLKLFFQLLCIRSELCRNAALAIPYPYAFPTVGKMDSFPVRFGSGFVLYPFSVTFWIRIGTEKGSGSVF